MSPLPTASPSGAFAPSSDSIDFSKPQTLNLHEKNFYNTPQVYIGHGRGGRCHGVDVGDEAHGQVVRQPIHAVECMGPAQTAVWLAHPPGANT